MEIIDAENWRFGLGLVGGWLLSVGSMRIQRHWDRKEAADQARQEAIAKIAHIGFMSDEHAREVLDLRSYRDPGSGYDRGRLAGSSDDMVYEAAKQRHAAIQLTLGKYLADIMVLSMEWEGHDIAVVADGMRQALVGLRYTNRTLGGLTRENYEESTIPVRVAINDAWKLARTRPNQKWWHRLPFVPNPKPKALAEGEATVVEG